MAQKSKKKPAAAKRAPSIRVEPKMFSVADLVRELNSFNVDNYWDLGKFLVERVIPAALKETVKNHPRIALLARADEVIE